MRDISSKENSPSEFRNVLRHRLPIDLVSLTTRQIGFTAIFVHRSITKLQQVHHDDRSLWPRLEHRRHLLGTTGIQLILYLHLLLLLPTDNTTNFHAC